MNEDKGGYFNCNNVWKLLHSMLLLTFNSGKKYWLQKTKQNKKKLPTIVVLLLFRLYVWEKWKLKAH